MTIKQLFNRFVLFALLLSACAPAATTDTQEPTLKPSAEPIPYYVTENYDLAGNARSVDDVKWNAQVAMFEQSVKANQLLKKLVQSIGGNVANIVINENMPTVAFTLSTLTVPQAGIAEQLHTRNELMRSLVAAVGGEASDIKTVDLPNWSKAPDWDSLLFWGQLSVVRELEVYNYLQERLLTTLGETDNRQHFGCTVLDIVKKSPTSDPSFSSDKYDMQARQITEASALANNAMVSELRLDNCLFKRLVTHFGGTADDLSSQVLTVTTTTPENAKANAQTVIVDEFHLHNQLMMRLIVALGGTVDGLSEARNPELSGSGSSLQIQARAQSAIVREMEVANHLLERLSNGPKPTLP